MFKRLPLLLLSLLLSLAHSSQLLAAEFQVESAILERGSSDRVTLNVNFAKLSAADLQTLEVSPDNTQSAENMFIRLLDICLVKTSEDPCSQTVDKAFWQDEKDLTPLAERHETMTAALTSTTIEQDPEDVTLYTIFAQILVSDPAAGAQFSDASIFATRIIYGNKTEDDRNIKAAFSLGVLSTPEKASVAGSKKTLTAYWNNPPIKLSNDTAGRASGVLALLVPPEEFTTPIPARTYDPNNATQVSAPNLACSLTPDTATSSCSLACEDADGNPFTGQYYIHTDDIKETLQYKVTAASTTTAASGSVAFTGIDNEDTHAIILQYQPDGINRSCSLGAASDAVTLVQLSTGKEPKAGSANCFIATAAYGSAMHAHIDTLRWFRDRYLLVSDFGQSFVKTYYRYGPYAADFIRDKPILRALVRGLLWLPVQFLKTWQKNPYLPWYSLTALSLLIYSILRRMRARQFPLIGQ